MSDRHVIATAEEFEDAVEALAGGQGPLAVDAERASGYRYSQRAYLIQVFRRDAGVFLFDPPAIGRMDAFTEALAGEEWILHAASQDLACLAEVGVIPERIFDTELAARLLGLPKVGLGAVVEQTLGITLAKEFSAVDWSTRPLPQNWLEYAALDVELLVDVRDEVHALLVEAKKTDIAREEFDAELHRAPKPPRAEPWRRLSGIHSVRGARHLAVARELWQAREELAIERDVSPGRLVPDASLVAAVKALPRTSAELSALKSFSGRASRSELERWWKAIQRGRLTEDLPGPSPDRDTLPPPRSWADKRPEADARLRTAKPRVVELAEELVMPAENLLTPDYLRRVSWDPSGEDAASVAADLAALGARAWQIERVAPLIASAFVEARQNPPLADSTAS